MLPQEHYFENLLFAFKETGHKGFDDCQERDRNLEYLSKDEELAIRICATYIIDCCDWDQELVAKLLD